MSLPNTGIYIADVDDHRICFNGKTWWSDDWPVFNQWYAEDLARESARRTTTHSTVEVIARRTLDTFFKGEYKEIHFESDTWKTELPEGAID